jgi:hypothetical protein
LSSNSSPKLKGYNKDPFDLKNAALALKRKHRLECPQSKALDLKMIEHFSPQMLAIKKWHER